jgi:microcystin-dependent protein
MSLPFYNWSRVAASNASADSTINWAEGQAPSSVNDSARAMMASTAAFRDDIAGAITTGGISTAYTVATYQVFDSFAHLDGKMIAFTPHTTNGATVQLSVDSLSYKPLRSAPGVELPSGVLIQGTPYAAVYNNSDGAFYLHGFFGNPYSIPIGSSIDFWGSTAPNSSFVLAYGQAISRTTYTTLFSLLGTTFGTGDGSTTFNVPDLRGRLIAGKDDMGGSAASRLTSTYFGTSAAALGAVGGSQSHTLTLGELPSGITSSGSSSITVNTSAGTAFPQGSNAAGLGNGLAASITPGANNVPFISSSGSWTFQSTMTGTNTINVASNNTSGNAHATIPPTIIANKLLRII